MHWCSEIEMLEILVFNAMFANPRPQKKNLGGWIFEKMDVIFEKLNAITLKNSQSNFYTLTKEPP